MACPYDAENQFYIMWGVVEAAVYYKGGQAYERHEDSDTAECRGNNLQQLYKMGRQPQIAATRFLPLTSYFVKYMPARFHVWCACVLIIDAGALFYRCQFKTAVEAVI